MRRKVLCAFLVLLAIIPEAPAALGGLRLHGTGIVAQVGVSKRSVINSNSLGIANFVFINALQQNAWGPQGPNWFTSGQPVWNSSILDGNGFCSNNAACYNSGAGFGNWYGGGVTLASSSNYSGQYIIDGTGTCGFSIFIPGSYVTFTSVATTNATNAGNGNWNVGTSGGAWKVTFTYTGPLLLSNEFTISNSDPSNTGQYCKNLRLYRNDGVDNVDIANGSFFRRPFLASQVALDGSFWRLLDWENTNQNQAMSWLNRALPGTGTGYATLNGSTWNAGCAYGDVSYSATNVFSIGATGGCTTTNMTNGELIQARYLTGMTRASNGNGSAFGITSIANNATDCGATQGEVVTSAANPFATGDIVIIPNIQQGGMLQLNLVPLKITVVSTTKFCISTQSGTAIDVSTYGSYASGNCPLNGCNVVAYSTLQVGTGSDRTAYPLFFADGLFPLTEYETISAQTYNWFVFDKGIGVYDIGGTFHAGGWRGLAAGGANQAVVYQPGMAAEMIAKFFNEMAALTPRLPISPWIHSHAGGMIPGDVDYTTSNDWPGNYVNTLLNGNGSWAGLNSGLQIIGELANETMFTNYSAGYLAARGFNRWGYFDLNSYSTLRSQLMTQDVNSFTSNNARFKSTQGLFSAVGASDGRNQIRINGNTHTLNDALNPSHLAPMQVMTYANMAAYIFDSNSLAPLSTIVSSWVTHIGNPTAQAVDMANFVSYIWTNTTANQQSSANYVTIMQGFASALTSYPGTEIIGYEGGDDQFITMDATGYLTTNGGTGVTFISGTCPSGDFIISPNIPEMTTVTVSGSTGTLSASSTGTSAEYYACFNATNEFYVYVKQSAAFASAWMSYFNAFNSVANAGAPADFIQLDQPSSIRWGHAWPSSYGWGAQTTEYQNLDATWQAEVARNATFPY